MQKKRFYQHLYAQVLTAIAAGILLGYYYGKKKAAEDAADGPEIVQPAPQ